MAKYAAADEVGNEIHVALAKPAQYLLAPLAPPPGYKFVACWFAWGHEIAEHYAIKQQPDWRSHSLGREQFSRFR